MATYISVIICTHNPRSDYLKRTFNALRAQTLPYDQWELLLIDNASKEHLENIWDISWHPKGRHIREDEIGLTPARLRGIDESCGKLLIFFDDDNLPASNYLEKAKEIAVCYPYLGVFGAGRIEPEFEVHPPPEINPYLNLLALRTVQVRLWSNNTKDSECIPWGAGLCITSNVANAYRKIIKILHVTRVLGRRGKQLFSGEDDIFSFAADREGLGFGIFPELKITHLISSSRLNQRYIRRLIRDSAFSHGVLSYMLWGILPKRIDIFRYMQLLLHGIRRGLFSMNCQWMESRGKESAAFFIAANSLRPFWERSLSEINHYVNRDRDPERVG